MEVTAGRLSRSTIEDRVTKGLDPAPDATPEEIAVWVDVIAPFAVQGRRRGGDDAELYRLAKAKVYCPRLRRQFAEIAESTRGCLGPEPFTDPGELLPRIMASPLHAPLVAKIAEGVPSTEELMGPRQTAEGRTWKGTGTDEPLSREIPGHLPMHRDLSDPERFGLLVGDLAEIKDVEARSILLDAVDWAFGQPPGDEDLGRYFDSMARSAGVPALSNAAQSNLVEVVGELSDLARMERAVEWIAEAPWRKLMEIVRPAIELAETQFGNPVPWQFIWIAVATFSPPVGLLAALEKMLPAVAPPEIRGPAR
jgi:hypothetical protein